jgi:hypothetical protein
MREVWMRPLEIKDDFGPLFFSGTIDGCHDRILTE